VLAGSTVLTFETLVPIEDVHPTHAVPPATPEIAGAAALGADIVEVAQVARSIATFGDRYLRRVFTDRELAYCTSEGRDPAPHLAARFAAKEAAAKALRVGDSPLDWRWIEVLRRADGACDLRLHGGMRALAQRRGVSDLRVSMSHDGAYAIAVVVGDTLRRKRTR
jgi:holo-[acyl-carrier protein] synthase